MGEDASLREVEYTAKGNVLPVRHVVVLRDKTGVSSSGDSSIDHVPGWVQDYALYLLDAEGHVASWYAGAERIHAYGASEAIGQHYSFLYPDDDTLKTRLQEELKRSAVVEGHTGARRAGKLEKKTVRDSGPIPSLWL